MLRNIWLALLIALAPVASAWAASTYTMVTAEGKVSISYTLTDRDGAFVSALLDHARAGGTVRVHHHIVMNAVKGLRWGDLAEAHAYIYISYNLFDDTYAVGYNPNAMRTLTDEAEVAAFALQIKEAPLVMADKLRTGDEYSVSVTATIQAADDKGGWLSYLPLNQLFRKELYEAFFYIAR